MSVLKGLRSASWAGMGAFCIGFSFIVAATVLNIAHDRLPPSDLANLPLGLGDLYSAGGKTGVTLLLVTTGLVIVLLGMFGPANYTTRSGAAMRLPKAPTTRPRTRYLYSSSDEAPAAPAGAMVLETRKYISPASALSGIPGWLSTQRNRPAE